uniref:Secreted protein n=1 Tax=Parascaris univalens TaxID=6257 RepID=A0A915CB61_PARUN
YIYRVCMYICCRWVLSVPMSSILSCWKCRRLSEMIRIIWCFICFQFRQFWCHHAFEGEACPTTWQQQSRRHTLRSLVTWVQHRHRSSRCWVRRMAQPNLRSASPVWVLCVLNLS